MERIEINANTYLAALGGMAVGCAAGGGLAYLLLRRSFESRLNSEVAEVKTRYNDRLKAALSDAISFVPEAGVPFVGRRGSSIALAREGSDQDEERSALGDDDDADDGEDGELHAQDLRLASVTLTGPLEGLEDGEEDPDDVANQELDARGEGDGEDPGTAAASVVDRDLRGPYVISLGEFIDPPPGWQQITITYFDADSTMVDDKNEPIPNFGKITGPIRGKQDFGGISDDPNLRYIRNQTMETDFEIIFNANSYAGEVLNYGQPNKER